MGSGKLRGLIGQPLLHFLVVGVALGATLHWMTGDAPREDATTIFISATDVARMDAGWRARFNRAPTDQELDGLIRSQIREMALHREALAMGLGENEPVVRRVLVQKLERIASDLIELSLAPTDLDLDRYYAEQSERYRPASRITFAHVFIDPDARDDRTLRDAAEILADLESRDGLPADIENFGDPFMLQRYYPEEDEQRIASLFGSEFARSVFELETGRWHGPVLSGYGTHLVYVESITSSPVPPLDEIRDEVTQDWVDENRRRISEEYFAQLLAKYDVVIEGREGL
jgi:parvulin-like peptidyl-prolyl isomerase